MGLSKKKAKAFFKEEKAASREYKKMGLTAFSKDEARHSRYFKMLLRRSKK